MDNDCGDMLSNDVVLQNSKKDLYSQLNKLKFELNEAKTENTINEYVRENIIQLERQNLSLKEELATMQKLLGESNDELINSNFRYEKDINELRCEVQTISKANRDLRLQLSSLVGQQRLEPKLLPFGQDKRLNSILAESTASLTDVTKTFARRVMMRSSGNIPVMLQNPTSSCLMSDGHAATVSDNRESLDDCMIKAHKDTELLRSIVIPLEEQISALKSKLRETDGLLREMEAKRCQELFKSADLISCLRKRNSRTVNNHEAMDSSGPNSNSDDDHNLTLDVDEIKEIMQDENNKGNGDHPSNLYCSLLEVRNCFLVNELNSYKQEVITRDSRIESEQKRCTQLELDAVKANNLILSLQHSFLAKFLHINGQDQKVVDTNGENNFVSSFDNVPATSTDDSTVVVGLDQWQAIQVEMEKMTSFMRAHFDHPNNTSSLHDNKIDIDHEKDKFLLDKVKSDESAYRKEVEEQWAEQAEAFRCKSEALKQKLASLESWMKESKARYNSIYDSTQQELKLLTADRDHIVEELKRLQDENDFLVGRYDALSIDMQKEQIDLPTNPDEVQHMLLNLRQELIRAKLGREKFENQISYSDVRVQEMEVNKKKFDQLEVQSQVKLNNEVSKLMEIYDKRFDKAEDNYANEKRDLEHRVNELHNKVMNLQQELDNSMAVQTDFVRLSQSLQIELEKIRQDDNQVRWQHEDDVVECQNCRLVFATVHRKHHCRHCGRVFCSDCVGHSVNSGPNGRTVRVCRVCHTVLVKTSAPYFSVDVP